MMKIEDLIFKKEKSLMDFPNRGSVDFLNKILTDDFIEVGSVGEKWNKQEIISRLEVSEPIEYEVKNFKVTSVSNSVMLATYRVRLSGKWSYRSSIWVLVGDDWLMKYHQGTLQG